MFLPDLVSLVLLLGIYGSSMYGGAIPAILINTPGTPVNALTTYDGYSMTRRGEGPRALALAYSASFYFMALVLRFMPVGIVYAMWSGLGIVLIALIGFLVFGQRLDLPAIAGLGLIIAGILVIHLFSTSATH